MSKHDPGAELLSAACPAPLPPQQQIALGHGSGGKLSAELMQQVFLPAFHNEHLARLDDQAVLAMSGARIAFSTDAFVVTPIFFPGGNIGDLAVNGTVNDLAMSGARPMYIAAAFILEEGLAMDELERVVASMGAAARRAGVQLVTGDTKVVERGKGDKIFITTTGIGLVEEGLQIAAHKARPGDKILLSGSIGDHGMAILSRREHMEFEGVLESDTAALHELVAAMLRTGKAPHCMRDPTRGGLATTLNELARQSGVAMVLDEREIPVRSAVRGACEILGLDPLYVANEGKLVAVVAENDAAALLQELRAHPLGREARVIGDVAAGPPGRVVMKTVIGGTRIVDMLFGEQLPRIC